MTFFRLFGISLTAGLFFTAAVRPLLWFFGGFKPFGWAEAAFAHLAGKDSGNIAQSNI